MNTIKIKRNKTNREFIPATIYDCVPAAISRMGRYAQSYEDVVADCDVLCDGWRNRGRGVCGTHLNSLMDLYTECNSTACGLYDAFNADSVGILESLVMTFPINDSTFHAVNAVAFNTFGADFVCYNDYSATSKGPGFIYINHPYAVIYMFND